MSDQRYEVQLPSEIIALIISNLPRDISYTRTLWACCLLSHEWYRATVGALYRWPQLHNRNFDKFARTICPPLNSHVRRVGLETLVHHLDMGALAYESSKSLTARMLRRLRINLETFVAPAVSFSISCLAPLSKCTKLKKLDLSRDFYDLDLARLLNSIKALPLEVLILPRGAMQRRCSFNTGGSDGTRWPRTLRHLEISDWIPEHVSYWRDLFESWPPSLVSVAFEDCFSWDAFWQVFYARLAAKSIKHVRIGMRREASLFPISALTVMFPNVTTIAIPVPRILARDLALPDVLESTYNTESQLEVLTLRKVAGLVRFDPFLPTALLFEWVQMSPRLYRINVPEGYLKIEEDSADSELEKIEGLMQSRVDAGSESGVYLT